MIRAKTFDKDGWREKPLSDGEGVILGCDCGKYVYFTTQEIIKSQSQEKYCYCDCGMQQLFYTKIIEEVK